MHLPTYFPGRLIGAAAIACAAALIPLASIAVTASPAASAAATSPAAAYSSNLGSVSCPHASWCVAVGSWSPSQQGPAAPWPRCGTAQAGRY